MAYAKPPKRTEKEWRAFKHWLANPTEAIKDWFGVTPDDWQGDALNAVFCGKEDRVAIKSAHGPGKSALDSWIGWVFLQCYEDSRVVAVAPTAAQLQDALFPEYAKWWSKMPQRMQDEWHLSASHIRHKGNPQVWFAVGRTSNRPENVQGFHGTHILVQGDEASGIPEPVFEVIEGILTEAGEEGRVAKLVINGNPNFTAGELYHAFNKNKEMYHRITVTGDPTLLEQLGIAQGGFHERHGLVYYSKRVRAKYVENMAKKYGRSSAVFDVRVRGVFPMADDECVIPYEWAARAMLLPLKKETDFDRLSTPARLVVDRPLP
jgi:phage terminase large subunit